MQNLPVVSLTSSDQENPVVVLNQVSLALQNSKAPADVVSDFKWRSLEATTADAVLSLAREFVTIEIRN